MGTFLNSSRGDIIIKFQHWILKALILKAELAVCNAGDANHAPSDHSGHLELPRSTSFPNEP